ncbi:MAG: TlyA family RNA methyltransferase [Polaromonas sp.]|nr:TlyA family RNA methyltransferase [Polaromonas sp.]
MRADLFLVDNGVAATRSQAQRLIASGVRWRAEESSPWKKVAKNGDEIPAGAEVEIPDTTEAKYISRGGLKLEGALKSRGLDVSGRRCLDIGQSTGGFTDCLLQQGALQVVGVDVGHGQLHPSLRADPRVVCIEGVNARAMTAMDLVAPGPDGTGAEAGFDDEFVDEEEAPPIEANFDLLTADLSFISLTLVLPAVLRLLKPGGDALMLVKPQFELQPGQIGKGGIVRDPAHFAFVEQRLRDACSALGMEVKAWLASPIEGGDGNREFFIHAVKGLHTPGEDLPLPAAPPRKAAKRTPRSELRALHAAHEDSEEAHAGQHGPARGKRRETPDEE